MTKADGGSLGDFHNWHETLLWSRLKKKQNAEAKAVRAMLDTWMPRIQTLLTSGGTTPLDFTLHDAGHAYRVARRMGELLTDPEDVLGKLSVYELALLLLAAYLHDIGMVPEQRKVEFHRQYLLSGERAGFDTKSFDQYQEWLDDHGKGLEPPVTVEQVSQAEELVTYYCRYRHNDWGEAWIREHLAHVSLGSYTHWVEDLIALCKSHHWGYHELADGRMNAICVPATTEFVNRRFLAVVLRTADILEFDPERTPQVILRHRDIAAASKIYWWKDHQVSIKQEGNRFVITARPPNARIHRAIEVMAEDIDEELALCRRLADEVYFDRCPGFRRGLPHNWPFLPSVHRAIEPAGDYEYINGAFRPDTEKLLELLSGTNLYHEPLAAVRELLQNAFDAVREQIAYQRLDQQEPGDEDLVRGFEKQHRVILSLETRGNEVWLVCKDTGVGMSKRIITDHLLISGAASRHDISRLERRCRGAGFSLGRTGQFGIGVLSYFMIADRLVITTRRSSGPDDGEAHGWRFETEGVGSFGELRKTLVAGHGTKVELRLKVKPDRDKVGEFAQRLVQYLTETLVRLPCHFEFRTDLKEVPQLKRGPGWVRQEEWATAAVIAMLRESRSVFDGDGLPSDVLPQQRQMEVAEKERDFEEARGEARVALRWWVLEGELRDDSGEGVAIYRLRLPYFALEGGESLVFLRVGNGKRRTELRKMGRKFSFQPGAVCVSAWKGMAIGRGWDWRSSQLMPDFGILEVDWHSSKVGGVTVNRHGLALTPDGEAAVGELGKLTRNAAREFLAEHKQSPYAWVSARAARLPPPERAWLRWLRHGLQEEEATYTWNEPHFPLRSKRLYLADHRRLCWQRQLLTSLPDLPQVDEVFDLRWYSPSFPPDRIGLVASSDTVEIVHLWTGPQPLVKRSHPFGMISKFPPNWKDVLRVSDNDGMSVWNSDHSLVRIATAESWDSVITDSDGVPLPDRERVVSDRPYAACYLAKVVDLRRSKGADLWNGIVERDAELPMVLWRRLFGEGSDGYPPLHVFEECGYRDCRLHVISPAGWQAVRGNPEETLGRAPEEWYLTSQEGPLVEDLIELA